MDFSTVGRALGLGSAHEPWSVGWRDDEPDRVPADWLSETRLTEVVRWLDLPDDALQAVIGTARDIRERAEELRLAQHLYVRMFVSDDSLPGEVGAWPSHHRGSMVYAVLCLSRVPELRAEHATRGVAPEVTRDTLRDLCLWMHHHRHRTGEWGMGLPGWFSHHFRSRLFHLGRLQFEMTRYRHPFTLLARVGTAERIVVAHGGLVMRGDGQFADADGTRSREAWTTTLFDDTTRLVAHLVDSRGGVLRETVELDRAEWRVLLEKGDEVLGVHIPEGGPWPGWGALASDRVGDSFDRAGEFFPRHFPERPMAAFSCATWLLDPQLRDYLPESSNIVGFQRFFHLTPVPGATGTQTVERVVGSGPLTTLQRIVDNHLRAGGRWRTEAGVRPVLDRGGPDP